MMLRMVLFCVYDVKAEVYFPPFGVGTMGEAVRVFEDLLSDPQGRIGKHPGDYRLFRVGEFDTETGVVAGRLEGVQLVEDGLRLVKEVASA